MNIFVILIMAVMLATYQYFTAKRSSDVVLNKDELKLQAELSCMKQFHNFASAKNEYIFLPETENTFSLKGTEENQANYNCTGSDDTTFAVTKYCLDASGKNMINCATMSESISCGDNENGGDKGIKEEAPAYHCVSTTKWKTFEKDDKYLMAQILKESVYIAGSDKYIQNKLAYFSEKPNVDANSGKTVAGIGLITCVNACKINSQTKLSNDGCKDDEIPIIKENGTIVCSKPSDASPCTAHEEESSSVKDKCTTVFGKICCAKNFYSGDSEFCKAHTNSDVCCPAGTNPEWNSSIRFYKCLDPKDLCSGSLNMKVIDEKGTNITEQAVGNAATAKYDENKKEFICNLTQSSFTDACKAKASEKEGVFLKVTNLTNSTKISKAAFEAQSDSIKPICHIALASNAKASENCNPCQGVEFDSLNNKWKCKNYTWSELNGNHNNIIDKLAGTKGESASGKTAKGTKACFSTCTTEQLNKIKSGTINEINWGLRFDDDSKIWNCFNCDTINTYNYGYSTNCTKNKDTGNTSCSVIRSDKNTNTKGKCKPFNCLDEFQIEINGRCYTKWCAKKSSDFPANADIGAPTDTNCPKTTPWMVYNNVKTCVYCIRPPSERGK